MQLKEEAVFTLKFDGKPVVNELGELEQRLTDVKEAQKSVERGTREWADNKAAIKELEASIKAVREEMGVSGMTVAQLQNYYRQLNSEIRNLTPGTEAYQQKAADLQEVNTALANHRSNIRAVNDEVEKQPSLWDKAKSTAAGFLSAFSATEILQQAFAIIKDGIKSALELSDMMGGVAKATGQSTQEVQQLVEQIDKIDTRTTKESLMDIAQIGGQLGVANDELLGFIQSTDMAAVALGDEFSGGAEEAANKLGGLKKLFAQTDELSYGDAIQKIGSAINELGADGSATGPVIADFTARMGQLGDLSPQITQTMGLGAAFQELGLSAEIGAGGLSNILLTAAKDTATFAQQLKISDAEMKNLINTNPNEFLLKLAESLRGVPADQLATRLYDLGIKSQEATKVMSLLKDQTELVRDKQLLANKAFAEGTSLGNEFTTMNSTAAAEYEKSGKALALIATEIGQGLLPAITKGAQGLVAFVNIIRAVPEFVSENKTSLAALGVAVLALNGNLIVATAASIAHAAAERARLIWTQSATTAQTLLNLAMTANPIGLVVAAVALLVAGFTALYNNSTTVRGIISGVWEVMKTGVSLVEELTDKVVGWIQKGLEPLRPVLDVLTTLLTANWNLIRAGISFIGDLTSAFGNFISNGLSRVNTALEPVRSALSSFWSLIDTGITKIKSIGSAITSFLHVDELVTKVKSAASQIGDAFTKGYGDKLAEDQPKQIATHQQTLNTKKAAEQKTATELVDIVTSSDQKAIDKKAAQNDKHRQDELQKAKEKAQKEADEAVKADLEGLKKIETLRIASIKDDLERSIATIRAKRDAEVEAMTASKASAATKAVWEQALNEQMIRDIAKAQSDALKKKEADETKARTDREKLERETSNAVASANYEAAHLSLEKQLADETLKISARKQLNMDLINLERTETLRKIEDQYNAEKAKLDKEKADAIRTAQEKGQTIDGIEAQFRQQYEAAELGRRNRETAAEQSFQNSKKDIEKQSLDQRKANQQAWFDAISGLMKGDFTQFLADKLAGEKKQLTDSQKANISKIDTVGSYAVAGLNALSNLNTAALNKEKETQLAAWKDKYNKGLISKDQYESGVDKINKEADQKTKQAQLEAFKRQQKIDIAMAIINGAQAALKSLAMLGWPLGLIAAAGAAVTAGIQIAMIKNQQPPSLARGGKITNAGVPDGPRHGNRYGESGLSITRRDTGEEVAEMEGGEPVMVLSRNTYRNNRGVVDALLHSSLHRNGAPVMAKGGIMLLDGGYAGYTQADQESSVYSGSSGGSTSQAQGEDYVPSSDPAPSSSWMDDANASAGEMDSSSASYQAEIDKNTAMMANIEKNTAGTVDGIKVMNDNLLLIQQQNEQQTTTQDTILLGKILDALVFGFNALADSISTDLQQVKNMYWQLGTELQTDLRTLIPALETALTTKLVDMDKANTLAIATLQDSLHLDLATLIKLNDGNFSGLGKTLHDDLTQLDKNISDNLGLLQKGVHTDMADFQNSNVLQQLKLLTEMKLNFTTLQTILQTELRQLAQTTHSDLADLQNANVAELKTVQGILNLTKNEQGYQSTLLRIISEKNLSVSVQTFVNVYNQIDVVVDKSNFK